MESGRAQTARVAPVPEARSWASCEELPAGLEEPSALSSEVSGSDRRQVTLLFVFASHVPTAVLPTQQYSQTAGDTMKEFSTFGVGFTRPISGFAARK